MKDLVRPCQNAFIRGRTIHDNYTYVSALAKTFRQSKTPALLLKLDIEKSFDTVSWEFLLEVLKAKGFGTRFTDLIAIMLASSSMCVLINGELYDQIHHQRGLRQGDPLLPLLFVIVSDCLGALFTVVENAGILGPIGNHRMAYRTSLYADDVMLFINPKEEEVTAVKEIPDIFGSATGLCTNFSKSSIIPVACGHLNLTAVVQDFGCAMQNFPCKYLGMPLSDSKLRKVDYQPAIDKLCIKLKGWNLLHFSLDGRMLLVKHILSAMVVF